MKISIGGGQTIDLNILLSAAINFILVAFVVYFFVVLPYNTLRKRGEVEQADDAQIVLLTEIRDLLAQNTEGTSGRHGGLGQPGQAPTPELRTPSGRRRPDSGRLNQIAQISRLDNCPMI